ncbi:major capsid protein [Microviridae sp.]|nr:major capsid protein [Microviridae sp.]
MNIFKQLMNRKVGSNKFDLSHDLKLSLNMGDLIPTMCMEVVPGDRFSIQTENMLRMAPMISPVMHQIKVTQHYFFVPNRLVWNGWEDFITGNSDEAPPTVNNLQANPIGSLGDYMGIPVDSNMPADLKVSAIPFAAYALIYDEWYRDQNLQDKIFTPLVSGDNTLAYGPMVVGSLQKRAWMHDYFTSALPFAQKGDAVSLPLLNNDKALVELGTTDGNTVPQIVDSTDTPIGNGNLETVATGDLTAQGGPSAYIDPNGSLEVDINAEAADINTLRRAFRLQEWLEKNARGGTRYIESILSHFGVRSSDARLQRPELIGSSNGNMVISEVLTTVSTDAGEEFEGQAAGTMVGHGINVQASKRFAYKAEEHGFIIGILNVQPRTAYSQGIHRSFSRFDKLDYFWPSFANIGEQAILNKELYAGQSVADGEETFGYTPRYSEYKYMDSRVAGDMRGSLNYWHMARQFANPPQLNESFIECVPTKRIFAFVDQSSDSLYAHVFNKVTAIRKMPKFGIPTI